MKKYLSLLTFVFVFLVLTLKLTSAVIVNSVEVGKFSPGQEGRVNLEIKNVFNDDVQDVSILLDFKDKPFIPIGSSEQTVDEITEDDEENFVFTLRASSDISPGQYEIPYTLTYELNGDTKTKTGTIGIKVESNPDLAFSITTDTPVLNRQGKIKLQIVNKGFFPARFVSVKALPEGYTLLSDSEVYIGEIASDDFDTANFDASFTKQNARFTAIVEYRDFNNNLIIKNVDLPLTVYSEDKAQQLGIVTKSQTFTYIISVIVIIILIIVWRSWRKRRRLKKSQKFKEEE